MRYILLFCILVNFTSARSVNSVINKIDASFHYPQKMVKKGFKAQVKYSAADTFIKNSIDKIEGEKAGKYYAIYTKKTNRVKFDVSSITPRLGKPVNAMLHEVKDIIVPRSIKSSLKKYKVKLHYEKKTKQYRLYAFLKKKKYKKPPPIVRVEYYLNKKYEVQRVVAFLMSGERIESKWKLKKLKSKKFLIQENQIVYVLKRGKVYQTSKYTYKNINGIYFPSKVVMSSKFEYGKSKVQTISFSNYSIY